MVLDYRLFTEEHVITMNRFVRVLLNGSKTLIIGVSLIVLPWLGSIYFCSRIPDAESGPNPSFPANSARAKSSSPHLLPASDAVRCLLTDDSRPQPILAADFPARQTNTGDSSDGTALADAVQAEKAQSAYIPPTGVVAEETFDESSADSSPPVWMPKEMPIAEKAAESSLGKATLPTESASNVGTAVKLPNQQIDLSAESSFKSESSPEPKTSESVANSASSAESVPAAESATVDKQSVLLLTDREQTYPSTEPFLAKRAAAKDLQVRSEQLESIARQADLQTRHGFELAGRGAYFAARSEFIVALRLVAQGLDTEGRTNIHGKSLAAGLTALKEAEDFIPGGSKLEAALDLPDLIAGHATLVLKDADKASVTTLTALKSYFTFAQEQLAQAAGSEVAGSMALHALGKLHEELAKGNGPNIKAAGPKAMVFYQASLLVCPRNFMAANDLGVMLARNGNYEDARKLLEHSLSLNRQSTVWHNLAVVQERLGHSDKAQFARQQALIAMQTEQENRQRKLVSSGDQVRWVDENAFAEAYNPAGILQAVPTGPAASGNPVVQQAGPVTPQTTGILESMSNHHRSVNDNAGQTPSTVGNPLPVLRPAATGWLPNTQYDVRR